MCENPSRSSPKEIFLGLGGLIVILDVIIVLNFSTHTVFIVGFSYVPRCPLLLLIDRHPCPHSMIIVMWWYYSPEKRLQGNYALSLYCVKLLLSTPQPHYRTVISSCDIPSSLLCASSLSYPASAISFSSSNSNPSCYHHR